MRITCSCFLPVLCMCGKMATSSKQSLLTTWIREPESSPAAKRARQGNEPVVDSTRARFEPRRLLTGAALARRLESYSQLYDIGSITEITKHLSAEEKFRALHNVYKPPPTYVFPQHTEGTHQRSFQSKWLNEHAWLAYSREKDGGYCVPCVFFCKDHEGPRKLVNSPLNKFKDAIETLRQHNKKTYHVHSVSDMLPFMQVMNSEQPPINHQLVFAVAQQVQKNREVLKSIIKTVIVCGKQNIALRGHRDDFKNISNNLGTMVTFMHF